MPANQGDFSLAPPGGGGVSLPAALPAGSVLTASGGNWIAAPNTSRFHTRWTISSGIVGPVQYLQEGENVVASSVGESFPGNTVLKGISFVADVAPVAAATRQYRVEVVRNPRLGAGATILATLDCPADGSTRYSRRRDISVALPVSTEAGEYGVRISRVSGSGDSGFSDVTVVLEWSIDP